MARYMKKLKKINSLSDSFFSVVNQVCILEMKMIVPKMYDYGTVERYPLYRKLGECTSFYT